jgi:fluoride exporter
MTYAVKSAIPRVAASETETQRGNPSQMGSGPLPEKYQGMARANRAAYTTQTQAWRKGSSRMTGFYQRSRRIRGLGRASASVITSRSVKSFELFAVGAGGAIGAILRYLVSGWVQQLAPLGAFPVGTLVVNFLGCTVLGTLGGLAESRYVLGPGARLFVFLGILGGFTTFSTFAYETVALVREGEMVKGALNVVGSVVLCLVGAWLGYGVASAR